MRLNLYRSSFILISLLFILVLQKYTSKNHLNVPISDHLHIYTYDSDRVLLLQGTIFRVSLSVIGGSQLLTCTRVTKYVPNAELSAEDRDWNSAC